MTAYSKYDLKKNPSITYLLGAGASYNSIPIWSEQGSSMFQVANDIKRVIEEPKTILESRFIHSPYYTEFNDFEKEYLYKLIDDINFFAEKARINKTIDNYAYILSKQGNNLELNNLKRVLSIYLDIWQLFLKEMAFRRPKDEFFHPKEDIDTRYIQWLNQITKSDSSGRISVDSKINIFSWNYDLQVELAYSRIYGDGKLKCLNDLNNKFRFFNTNVDKDRSLDIYHLNGFQGYFNYEKANYPTATKFLDSNFHQYLKNLCDNVSQFIMRGNEYHNYNSIKFSWENKTIPEEILKIAKSTDIFIVIGYSFPQYNRRLDRQIIDAVKENEPLYIYYQDPTLNYERIADFVNFSKLKFDKVISEFFIPDEFINPESYKPIDIDAYLNN